MIELERVDKAFAAPVLRGVSLRVPAGCLYGLIGPGASGKSVLLKTVAGLIRPDAGRVLVDGQDLFALPDVELQRFRLRFGMLFQNNALFDHMTVADNIAFPLRRMTSLGDGEIRERVAERLACVALPGFEARMPAGLSGGQKKRIGVARATVTRAPVLLYDEPAAGLDPVTSQKIFDLLRAEQRAAKSTVLMVSSDLDRMLTVTDRVGMLYRGRLIFDGTTEEAKSSRDPHVRQFVHGLTEGPL
ncbi:MAG TPA: ATP-binding cassette domain-containing protein [Polyangiaceae bacterium]|nr:ATP-binding cassette domain-containing protein [Polyangiaceae bacterium]